MNALHATLWRFVFILPLLTCLCAIQTSYARDGASMQQLIADLRGNDQAARRRALETLVGQGPAGAPAVQALIEVLNDKDELNRDYAITTLKGIGPAARSAVPALSRVAKDDPSADIRSLAENAVKVLGGGAAAEPPVAPVPPVMPAPPPTPPAAVPNNPLDAVPVIPAEFKVVQQSGSGVAMIARQPDVKSVQAAMRNSVRSLAKTFDAKPIVSAAYMDDRDVRGGASFTATLHGQAVRGAIIAGAGPEGAVVSVVYYRADADPRSLSLLAAGLTSAPRDVQMQTVNIPDGSGSVQIPMDWRLVSGQRGMCTVRGPDKQELQLGIATSAVTPELAEYRRNMVRNMNIPPQDMLVASPDDPVRAWTDLLPQLSVLCEKAGQSPFRLVKVLGDKPVENPSNWPSAFVDYLVDVGPGDSPVRSRAIVMVICAPVGGGQWMLHFSQIIAPVNAFDRDLLMMMDIWGSWNVSNIEVSRRLSEAAASMRETSDILRRAREERAAHEAQRHAQQEEANKNADFDEALRGWRSVEDTLTGERKTVDLGNVEIVVRELNEREGWARYRDIPQRNDW